MEKELGKIISNVKSATLCFVKSGDKILMINRIKPPFMGMWNAVGGKVKTGESVECCAIREVYEESGLYVKECKVFSEFTWNYDDETGYAVLFNVDEQVAKNYGVKKTGEGIVTFVDIEWIINDKNYGVIEDLKVFIEDIKQDKSQNYHLVYDGKSLKEVIKK